jgi:hypothetical protein
MGKVVQVNPGFSAVALPPLNLPFNSGKSTTLTDAEYAALPPATVRAVTVTQSGVLDPVRAAYGNPQSAADALNQAVAYANATFLKNPSSAPADGQLMAWAANLGQLAPVNPTGAAELASAINTTATATTASTTGGLGTAVIVAATSISVATSGGRPVTFHFGCGGYQSAAGAGGVILTLQETTSGTVNKGSLQTPLPNVAYAAGAAPAAVFSIQGQFPLGGAIASTRTFRLTIGLWTATGVTATINLLNSATAPSYLRAVAG